MRRIVEALFYDAGYPADDDYVRRRYESSIAPGAWEAVAAARFRRPELGPAVDSVKCAGLRAHRRCRRWSSKAADDKLLPAGLGRRDRQADRRRRVRSVVDDAGHCPQIEQSSAVNELLLDFPTRAGGTSRLRGNAKAPYFMTK